NELPLWVNTCLFPFGYLLQAFESRKTVPGNTVLQHVDLQGVRPDRPPCSRKKREGGRREVDALATRMEGTQTRPCRGPLITACDPRRAIPPTPEPHPQAPFLAVRGAPWPWETSLYLFPGPFSDTMLTARTFTTDRARVH